ncbi:hypothetical protein ABZ671_01165 [Micromonospora sp. NPDC006766]|uniref:hypothetical protein n=1 Tax=Micromonospora sp. NPDC006766 TaxID=3154778 RepID=UPI0033F825F1
MSSTTEYRAGDTDDFPEGAEMPDRPFLTRSDVAAIGARVQGVESMRPETISQHRFESREEIPLKSGGTRRGKYADDPFPEEDGYVGKAPWWDLERGQQIEEWFERHPRRQKGDGIGGRGGVRRVDVQAQAAGGPVRRRGNVVTVEVRPGEPAAEFDARLLAQAVELRRKHPRDMPAVVNALAFAGEITKAEAREYGRAAGVVIAAGVTL